MLGRYSRIGMLGSAGLVALLAAGCGGSKKKMATDPVATAMKTPGIRTVVIPKQRNDVSIIVPPCTAAAIEQTNANRRPPGSNEIVVPSGTLTQTVAVPPCPAMPKQAVANTVVVTPGGTGAAQEASTPPQSQLVLPRNSSVETIIVPPCTMASGGSSGGSSSQGSKSVTLPADSKTRSVTAPPCKAQPSSSS